MDERLTSWEIRAPDPFTPTLLSLCVMLAVGVGLVVFGFAVPSRWYLALFGLVVCFAVLLGFRVRRRPELLVLRVGPAGLAIGPRNLEVSWERVTGIERVEYRGEPYLRVEVASPYKLLPMRSKKLHGWAPHVWSFNGQPINISARELKAPLDLDEVERELRTRAPERLRVGSS